MVEKIAHRIIAFIQAIPPEKRRLYAAYLLEFAVLGWVASHIVMVLTKKGAFEHILMAISWGAIVLANVDIILTTDVRAEK